MNKNKTLTEKDLQEYERHFDKNAGHRLLKNLRRKTRYKNSLIATPVAKIVEILGNLLSAYENPLTPVAMKGLIVGAVGYIILPVDLIPDFLPVVGWTDDIAAGISVVATVMTYSTFSLKELDDEIDAENK